MIEYSRISLLEMILMDTGRRSLSDLSTLPKEDRVKIANHIRNDVPLDIPTLQDYNEVLHYLLCESPKESKEAARMCLLKGLQ